MWLHRARSTGSSQAKFETEQTAMQYRSLGLSALPRPDFGPVSNRLVQDCERDRCERDVASSADLRETQERLNGEPARALWCHP